MVKRGLIIAFFVLVISAVSLNIVSAQISCQDSSQTILRISSAGNAHAEVYNGQGNYNTEICYEDLFGQAYIGNNPHACTGANLIFNLSADTNAHVKTSGTGNYNTRVCYGDLECFASGPACSGEYVEVATISANTNAHIETRSANQFNSGLKICCRSPSAGFSGEIGRVEWRNLADRRIGETIGIESNVNSTVRLYAETTFPEGQEINFDIYEDDLLGDDFVTTLSGTTNLNGIVKVDWLIDDEAMEKGENGKAQFYFDANTFGTNNVSDILVVNNLEAGNEPPRANITSPVHRGIYFIGEDILFNQSSYDNENAIVEYLWTIEDDNTIEYTTNEPSFVYFFPDDGLKTITLKVTDDGGLSSEDEIAVVAVGEEGMLAYINIPRHQQIVLKNEDPLILDFSSDDSYVIELNGSCPSTLSIECLSGICPSESENHPQACSDNIPVNNPNQGFASMHFKWSFDDGHEFEGNGLVSGQKVYPLPSNTFNDKLIELTLNYNDGNVLLEKLVDREFTLLNKRQCLNDGTVFVFLDDNGFIVESRSTLDSDACAGANRIIGDGDDCCPSGMVCTSNGCRGDENAPDSCSDYVEESSCDLDEYGIGRLPEPVDPLWDQLNCGKTIGGFVYTCECAWNGTVQNGECGLELTKTNAGGNNEVCEEYTCNYLYEEGECIDGQMEVTIRAEFNEGTCGGNVGEQEAECRAGEGTFTLPCGRPTIELPFFETRQIASALIVVGLIYLAVHYFRKEER